MQCEKCGGECFDETKSKFWNNGKTKDGKQKPRWKCKDKDSCGWVKYEKAETSNGAARADRPTGPLAPVYDECYATAAKVVSHYAKALGVPYSMTDVTQAAATVFIAASQSGRPVKAPKQENAEQNS